MASESPTQMAREAKHAVDLLKQDVELFKERLDALDLIQLRERVAVLESHVKKQDALLEELKPTRAEAEELGALKNRISQLEDEKKRGETRSFQVTVLFLGGVITLAIQIALLFLKK